MTTPFIATVKTSGGDYTTLAGAEAGLQNDITAATIKVFSISAYSTPTIAAGDSVTGVTSGATGTCVLVNASRTQILIKSIASGPFSSGEVVKKTSDAGVNVTISDAGDDPSIDIVCYPMEDTAYLLFAGWTTSNTNRIHVYTPTDQRHDGKWDTTAYRLNVDDPASSKGWSLQVQIPYMDITGVQFRITRYTSDGGAVVVIYDNTDTTNWIHKIDSNLFIYDHPDGNQRGGHGVVHYPGGKSVYLNNIGTNRKKINNLSTVYAGLAGYKLYATNITLYAYNCTNRNFNTNFCSATAGVTLNSVNCIGTDAFTNGDFYQPAGTHNKTTCVSKDSSGNITGAVPTFIAYGTVDTTAGTSIDLHLDAADTVARNAGTDLSGDATYPFDWDIDQETRSGSWDCGADETAGAEPPPTFLYICRGRIVNIGGFGGTTRGSVVNSGGQ